MQDFEGLGSTWKYLEVLGITLEGLEVFGRILKSSFQILSFRPLPWTIFALSPCDPPSGRSASCARLGSIATISLSDNILASSSDASPPSRNCHIPSSSSCVTYRMGSSRLIIALTVITAAFSGSSNGYEFGIFISPLLQEYSRRMATGAQILRDLNKLNSRAIEHQNDGY